MMHDPIDRRAERRPNTRQIARLGHPHVRVPDALVDVIRQLCEVLDERVDRAEARRARGRGAQRHPPLLAITQYLSSSGVVVLRLREERKPVVTERIWVVVVVVVAALLLLLLVLLVLLLGVVGRAVFVAAAGGAWLQHMVIELKSTRRKKKLKLGLSFMERLVSPGHILQPSVLFLEPLSYFAGCESSGKVFN